MISSKKLTLVLIAILLIQLLVTVPAEFTLTRLAGDAVRETLFDVIETADEVLGKAVGYALLAALGVSWYYRCVRRRATVLYTVCLLLPRIASTATAAFQSGFRASPGAYLFTIWVDALVELILTAVVLIAAIHLRKRRFGLKKRVVGEDGRFRYVPTKYYGKKLSDITEVFLCAEIAVLALEVINELFPTVSFFIKYSDPTAGEIISIVTRYVMFLVYSVIGFFVMRAILAAVRTRRTEIADLFDQSENV